MIGFETGENIYIACGATDMRKSIDGLAALVKMRFQLDPFSPAMFVFCGSTRDRIKILRWDHNGFWLYYRRLETGKFQWPNQAQECTLKINRRELGWLLDGLTLSQKQAHQRWAASIVG